MIRDDERYWANMVLDVIEHVERPMLMYEGEKMIVRKALKSYLEANDSNSEKPNNCKDEPQICDTCRYYNSNIPCGSTPSACKEADKFAEEFIDGLKKLKPKDEPQPDDFFREPTAEERKAVAEYIDSISVPTGVNIFDLMDESQTDCDKCETYWNCQGQCDEMPQIEDEPQHYAEEQREYDILYELTYDIDDGSM